MRGECATGYRSWPYRSSKSINDRLWCIAEYYSGCTSDALHCRRLPLAWVAMSPSARIIAERIEAERLVFFRFLHESALSKVEKPNTVKNAVKNEEDPVPLMFATSTTSLATLQDIIYDELSDRGKQNKRCNSTGSASVLGEDNISKLSRVHLSDAYNSIDDRNLYRKRHACEKTRCGTHIAGLITVLVSARDLLDKSLKGCPDRFSTNDAVHTEEDGCVAPPPGVSNGHLNEVWIKHEISGTPLRDWLRLRARSPTLVSEKEGKSKKSDAQESADEGGDLAGAQEKMARHAVGLLSSLPCAEKYLFPITALPHEVMSVPEMVNFSCLISTMQNGEQKKEATRLKSLSAADDQREKLKSAVSTLNASRLEYWAAHLSLAYPHRSPISPEKTECRGQNEDLLYRIVLVIRPDAVEKVMLGVSQWWLQRPIQPWELGYRPSASGSPQKRGTENRQAENRGAEIVVPIQLKIASLSAANAFCVPMPIFLLSVDWFPTKQTLNWCGLSRTRLENLTSTTFPTKYSTPASENVSAVRTLLSWVLFVASIALAIPLLALLLGLKLLLTVLAHCVAQLCDPQHFFCFLSDTLLCLPLFKVCKCPHEWLQNRLRERAGAMECCHWLYHLGATYADQLQALDVSHSPISGTHLLAFSLGNQTATYTALSSLPTRRSALEALDVAGCLFLDKPCDAFLFQTEADVRRYLGVHDSTKSEGLNDCATTVDKILEGNESLKILSHAGRALARLCLSLIETDSFRKQGVQLINASGSSLDSAALEELGQCALMYEYEAAHRYMASSRRDDVASESSTKRGPSLSFCPGTVPSLPSSLVAINLTSCRKVSSLNALSYVASLVQIIAPFTDVRSAGAAHLDGSAFDQVLLRVYDALHPPKRLDNLHSAVKSPAVGRVDGQNQDDTNLSPSPLFPTETSFESLLSHFVHTYRHGKNESVHDFRKLKHFLELRFQSHLYHLDITFCLGVQSLAPLCSKLWLLHYLNVSHTNVRTTELAEAASLQRPGLASSSHPPLRVLVAEYCNLLNNLDGLQLFPHLTKLYVRNGSLDNSGLSVFASHAACFPELVFLDLSYCDKVEDVSMLASLPSLETLILDNTEISRDGIKGLGKCPMLRTLSIRFCPDFAPVGPKKECLERMVVRIPTLRNYIYENLASDEVHREDRENS